MIFAASGHEQKPVSLFVDVQLVFVPREVPAHFAGKDDLVKALLDANRKYVAKFCYRLAGKIRI